MSTIKKTSQSISVEVSLYVYKDSNYPNGDMYIAYCPELDMCGYDTTIIKARKSFEYVLKDYLDYAIGNGTLEEDLVAHGWKIQKNGKIKEPSLSNMLKNSRLKSVLSMRELNKYPFPINA